MDISDIILIAALVVFVVCGITSFLYELELRYLKRENQMFRRLLSDQASLHEMSLNAYIAMLREAQRHMGGQ